MLCYLSVSCATTTLAKATLNDLFAALTAWIVGAVQWLLTTLVAVLNATSNANQIVSAGSREFTVLLTLSPLLLMLGLLVATVQALRQGDSANLWRLYLGVAPACVAGIVLARPLAEMIVAVMNELASLALGSTASQLTRVGESMAHLGALPSFAVFLLAGLLVLGSVLLWLELLFRGVVLSFLLVLVPVVVPLAVFGSLRRIGWRLAETFLAVAASKVVVAIALALGLQEITIFNATSILEGVVTLLLACATPFLLLRLVPFMENAAHLAFDGARQRAVRAVMTSPQSPVGRVVGAMLPAAPIPGPPTEPDDWGIPEWEGDGDLPLPRFDAPKPPLPVGPPRVRHGHKVIYQDKWGPVLGWHWDD